MKLNEAKKSGLVQSPSVPRWLAHGEIPHIRPTTQGVTRDLSAHELALIRVFEIVATVTNSNLDAAANAVHLVHQKLLCGILTPLVLNNSDAVRIEIDLVAIVDKIAGVIGHE